MARHDDKSRFTLYQLEGQYHLLLMKIASIYLVFIIGLIFVQACARSIDGQTPTVSADAEHSDIVKRDLLAIISLQESPCQKVVIYDVQNELDYVATCETGDRYRGHVSS